MLRVRRNSVRLPDILLSDEARQARLAITTYLQLDQKQVEQRRPPVNDRIFRSPMVVDALRLLFRDKCAYCETAVSHGEEQVEHFRPLGFAGSLEGRESRHHYVWLAYEWENLLLACTTCSMLKKSLFPVAGNRDRLRATLDEILAYEVPELVDPTRDDPWAEMRMAGDGTCRPLRRKGEVTIAILQLNRKSLIERRARDLRNLRARFPKVMRDHDLEALSLMFDLSREFIGSRLDMLHRALVEWIPAGIRIPAARQSLPDWFYRAMQSTTPQDSSHLAELLEEVFLEDEKLPEFRESQVDQLAGANRRVPPAATVSGRQRRYPDREIRSIAISNYKGIERLSLEITRKTERKRELPCLMLLGENAAGKSSVLEALALTLVGTKAATKLNIPGSDFLRRDDPAGWSIVDPQPPRVVVHFRDEGEPAELRVTADGRRLEGTGTPSVLVLAYGARRRYSDKSKPSVQPSGLIRNLFFPDQTLPSADPWLLEISKDEATFNAVARALREVLALDASDELVMDGKRLSVRVLGRLIPVERLSEGYRSLFSLAVDIARNLLGSWPDLERARAIVLIDEIETHLHPRWKMRIVSALRRAFPGIQFVISTHDPLCLRGMDDGEVEVIERDAKGMVHRLADLPAIRGMSAEQILTSDYFGLFSTADPELEWDLTRQGTGSAAYQPDKARDDELISRIVLGDTVKQQIIHEALDHYLQEREQRRGQVRARKDAVEAVLEVLRDDGGTSAP